MGKSGNILEMKVFKTANQVKNQNGTPYYSDSKRSVLIDWDGNELLLSDILGTDSDSVYKDLEFDVEKQMLTIALSKLSKREKQGLQLLSKRDFSLLQTLFWHRKFNKATFWRFARSI